MPRTLPYPGMSADQESTTDAAPPRRECWRPVQKQATELGLASVVGQIGLPGGGVGFGHASLGGVGAPINLANRLRCRGRRVHRRLCSTSTAKLCCAREVFRLMRSPLWRATVCWLRVAALRVFPRDDAVRCAVG